MGAAWHWRRVTWMRAARSKMSRHADVAKAMDYMLKRWQTFSRFLDDGRICLTNNAAERALRGIALGRKSWLFAGSDRGGVMICAGGAARDLAGGGQHADHAVFHAIRYDERTSSSARPTYNRPPQAHSHAATATPTTGWFHGIDVQGPCAWGDRTRNPGSLAW
jgi:hypothetical protein